MIPMWRISVAAHAEHFTGVFSIDVVAPDAVAEDEALDGQGASPGMRHLHLRLAPTPNRRTFFADEAAFPVWQYASDQRPVGLHADAVSSVSPLLETVIERFPEGADHRSTISPRAEAADGPPFASARRRCGRWRNIRTSISSSPTGRSSNR